MVDREVFDRRLAHLEERLRRLRSVGACGRDAFFANDQVVAASERWLHLAAEACLDLAHHLIADRGWRTPATYRDAFAVLREEGILDADLADRMTHWAGLRNVLVHLYLDVDHDRIWSILDTDLDDLERYAAAVVRAVED